MSHKLGETPRERLMRVMSYSLPRRRELNGPVLLVAAGLLILIATMLAISFVAGSAAAEIFRSYAEWVIGQ